MRLLAKTHSALGNNDFCFILLSFYDSGLNVTPSTGHSKMRKNSFKLLLASSVFQPCFEKGGKCYKGHNHIRVKAAFNKNFLYSKEGPNWTGHCNRSFFMTSDILSSALVKLFQMTVNSWLKPVHINWKLRYSYNRQRIRGRKFIPLLQFTCFWYVVLELPV